MSDSIRTFHQAKRVLQERLGPMTHAEQVACESLDARLQRTASLHREHHEELGVELCYSCSWPLTQPERVVDVKIANGMGVARCCGNLCASKVREVIGAPE